MRFIKKIIPKPRTKTMTNPSVSVIIPCKDEVGTIDALVRSMPQLGLSLELLFIDGHSTDGTWEAIQSYIRKTKIKPARYRIRAYRQQGKGKWDAVSLGFAKATGDILMIFDADLSMEASMLSKFYATACKHPYALIIGSRFIYPQESGAMRLLNHTGNILFSRIFSVMLKQKITDTLCGTKVLYRNEYDKIIHATSAFRHMDPFGDFTLLLGAAKRRMPIVEVPVSYKARVYGQTKISRFRDGLRLLVVLFHSIRDFRSRK